MKARYLLLVIIVFILIVSTLVYGFINGVLLPVKTDYLDVYVGVDVAFDNVDEIKTLVDAISPFTNLLIVGSTGISYNQTKLNDMCQYIYDKGLSFIVFTNDHDPPAFPSREWIESAKNSWGDRFLGLYVYDEVGGKHLDQYPLRLFDKADNYTDARNQFVAHLEYLIQVAISNSTDIGGFQTFSSDYGLYWFDYKAGYDAIFAEFALNYSRQLNIALCRGAAVAQNKDWGVIITHTYTEPPYFESGTKLYDDMVFAYENGAKYIVLFDSNGNYTHGTLTVEHLHALKQFTEYAHSNPRNSESTSERTAFVLPKDFGYGFRGPEDKIWGLWEADDFSYNVSVLLGNLLQEYGNNLDIIYDDRVDYNSLGYNKFIFWNGIIVDGYL
jgi:hypothetical protein